MQPTTSPPAPEPNPHLEVSIARAEARLAVLERLATIGLHLAELVGAHAAAAMGAINEDKGGDPTRAFATVSRSVRLTLLMQGRVDAQILAMRKALAPWAWSAPPSSRPAPAAAPACEGEREPLRETLDREAGDPADVRFHRRAGSAAADPNVETRAAGMMEEGFPHGSTIGGPAAAEPPCKRGPKGARSRRREPATMASRRIAPPPPASSPVFLESPPGQEPSASPATGRAREPLAGGARPWRQRRDARLAGSAAVKFVGDAGWKTALRKT